jgi:NitT/TauT family transport system substrate-binding protein
MQTSRKHAIAGIAAGVTLAPALVRAQSLTTIHVNSPPSEQLLPLAYAMRAGLFERAGIKIELSKSSSGAATAAAVASGASDIGFSSMLAVVLGFARGVPFTILAPSGIQVASSDRGLLVASSSTLRTAKDFVGKTFAAAAVNDITLLVLRAWMDQNGADSSTVKVVEIPQAAAPVALEQGRVDGIMVSNPAYTMALAGGKARLVTNIFTAISPRWLIVCWFTTTGWVERNRALAERFARVHAEAATYVNTHVEETLDDLVQMTGLDRALCQRMHRSLQTQAVIAAEIQPVIDVAVKYKVLEKGFSARELISDAAVKG